MRFLAFTLIGGIFAAGTADADSCRNRVVIQHRAAVVHHQAHVAAVVTPVAVATFVPIQVAVPTYSVGVAPQQVQQVQQAQQPDATAAALEKLAAAIERMGQQTLPAQAPISQGAAHLQILSVRCASCHDTKVSQQKGGGLTLLDSGKEVQLNPKQILRVLATTHDGTMPKSGAKLNANEKRAIGQWVESLVQ